jgi:hypothetical protein
MSMDVRCEGVKENTGTGISVLLSKSIEGTPGLASPFDGRIAINSRVILIRSGAVSSI